jgi:ligand-binding sensor domain-containing protein
MMPGATRAGIALAFALLLVFGAATGEGRSAKSEASDVTQDARWVQFTKEKDGLVSNNVWAILAGDGALWFGGDGGVSSFTGEWTSYGAATGDESLNVSDVEARRVQALAIDAREGTLWAATDTGEVTQWNGSAWTKVVDLPAPALALTTVAGDLWIGTTDGLYRFDGIQAAMVDSLGRQPVYSLVVDQGTVWVGAQNGLWRHREGRWLQIGSGEPALAGGVYALLLDREGALVVGTPYGVGWRLRDGASWQWFETVDEQGAPVLVQSLAQDRKGALWAGTDGAGVFAIDLAHESRQPLLHLGYNGDPDLTTAFVRDVAVDQDGALWLATPVGVYRYQVQMWVSDLQGAGAGDPLNHINDLLVEREGALWVATGGGGVRRKPAPGAPEEVFAAVDGAADTVLVLEQDNTGAVWAGGFEGLRRYAGGAWSAPVMPAKLPDPTITALQADGPWLWIGTAAGLVRHEVTSGEIAGEPALAGQLVEALALDNLGRLWVGTAGSGVWLREGPGLVGAQWRNFRHDPAEPDGLPGDVIGGSGLAPDSTVAGGMWAIVRDHGLVRWDGSRWLRGDPAGALPSNLLWSVYTDPADGSLWVGSEAGVTRFDGRTWGTLGAQDGLPSAVVYTIVRAVDGGYWLGGRTGLSYFLPDQTAPWVAFGELVGGAQEGESGEHLVTSGDDILIGVRAGDLQTTPERLAFSFRLIGPDQDSGWQPVSGAFIRLHFDTPGDYTVELLARDHSFNYSEVAVLPMSAAAPPVEVDVPLLGRVETGVYRTLVILGSIAMMGAAYITLEVLSTRRRGLQAVERGYNPYISGEPVRRDDMFFGRHDLVQRIVDTLHNNSIMIYGERRIGKTTLLYQLVTVLREVNDPDYWFVPIYVDLEGTAPEFFFHYLMEEIVAGAERLPAAGLEVTPQLAGLRVLDEPGESYSDRDFYRDLNRLTLLLEGYGFRHVPGKRLRIILLMDEMDVMSSYPSLVQQQLRRIFMREFAATLGAVVAGIQISKDWDRVESPWYNLFNEIALAPFTRDQAIDLFIEPVRGYYTCDPSAVEFVLDHANGRPYKIQQYGLEAVNHMLADGRRRITLADVEVAHLRIQAADLALRHAKAPARNARFWTYPVSSPQGDAGFSPSGEAGNEVGTDAESATSGAGREGTR